MNIFNFKFNFLQNFLFKEVLTFELEITKDIIHFIRNFLNNFHLFQLNLGKIISFLIIITREIILSKKIWIRVCPFVLDSSSIFNIFNPSYVLMEYVEHGLLWWKTYQFILLFILKLNILPTTMNDLHNELSPIPEKLLQFPTAPQDDQQQQPNIIIYIQFEIPHSHPLILKLC